MQEYDRESIGNWVRKQWESEVLDVAEVGHVTDCLFSICQWYFHDKPLYDPFFEALLSNNLMQTFAYADNTNQKVMGLYVKFLYNKLPADYRTKIKEVMK